MNALTETRIVTYYLTEQPAGSKLPAEAIRRIRVSITEGYSTEQDIPKILAVKHFSSNEPAALAKVVVVHIHREEA